MVSLVDKYAKDRVVSFKKDRPSKNAVGMWFVPRQSKSAGLSLAQDDHGCILLMRQSRDGFMQGYRLFGADGKPLRVEAKFRGSRECKYRGK